MIWYSKKLIEIAKQNTQASPSTWHKIMNPLCSICAAEQVRK